MDEDSKYSNGYASPEAVDDTPTAKRPRKSVTSQALVDKWKSIISATEERSKEWREKANAACLKYRGELSTSAYGNYEGADSFNIMFSNIETIRPSVYSKTPAPDIRPRPGLADPATKLACGLLEKAIEVELDQCNFDRPIGSGVVMDGLKVGRGCARLRVEPLTDTDKQTGEERVVAIRQYPEYWAWDRVVFSPAREWKTTSWIAYKHYLTPEEVEHTLGEKWAKENTDTCLQYTYDRAAASSAGGIMYPSSSGTARVPENGMAALVYEIWDKEEMRVLWIAESYPYAPLLIEENKDVFPEFFDMPEPFCNIRDPYSETPIIEYEVYRPQAEELSTLSARIAALVSSIQAKGAYPSGVPELAALFESTDNQYVPVGIDTSMLMAGSSNMEKLIWTMPIEPAARVVQILYLQREQLKQTIYEIIGISDILRGDSKASETLGAQQIKVTSGSIRMKNRQQEMERFCRDMIRMMVSVIVNMYPIEQLAAIAGATDPRQIQILADAQAVLKEDLDRSILIDVETDSTIALDVQRNRAQVSEILNSISQTTMALGPLVEAGAMSKKTAMALLASFMRHAKLGREVEDALAAEQANPPEQQPQEPPKPDHEPEKIAAMREAEASRAEIEKAKLQIEHARLQLEESKLVSTENAHVAQLQLQEQLDAAKRAHELRLKALDIEAKRSIEEMQAQNKLQIEALRGEIQAQISSLQSGQEQARKNTEEAKRSVDDLGGKMAASMGEIMQAIAKMNKTVVLKKDPVTQTISGSIQTS